MPGTADVGLLAVSGADSPDVIRDAADSGFDGFVSKPVDLRSLLERVDRLGIWSRPAERASARSIARNTSAMSSGFLTSRSGRERPPGTRRHQP
jgi:DNA-binding NarL/FixJ family response regulator